MISCFIRYDIAPYTADKFAQYARVWNEAIPRCGGRLVGYYGPHEGSLTTAYAIIDFENLAAYEAYRAALRRDKQSMDNFNFAKDAGFILHEERQFFQRIE